MKSADSSPSAASSEPSASCASAEDEVGLSGLARAEHAHAHFPRGGGSFLAQGAGEPVALAQERLAGGACGLRICPDPFVNAGERFDARFALFDKLLIVYGH